MYDFKYIDIITHVRLDNDERIKNALLREKFYRDCCANLNFIYVEDDTEERVRNYLDISDDNYRFEYNDDEFKKTASYNIGAKLSKRRHFCFLDLDCFIHPEHILESASYLEKNDNLGLIIPYNGVAIYMSDTFKQKFEDNPTYEMFEKVFPQCFNVYYQTEDLLIGNNQAVGGCVMARCDVFKKYNGFNPRFQGWGFEDNELPRRVHILGYGVVKLQGKKQVLWHLPHGVGQTDRAKANKYYKRNHQVVSFVELSTKDSLEEYIHTW